MKIEEKCINTIRCLAIDAVEKANSGHPGTLNAYLSHGEPALRIEDHIKKACWVMSELTELGIDIDSITKKLESDGVEKFIKAFDKLMESLTKKSFG